MEDSLSSSVNNSVASKGTIDTPEESGWTAYFEDFFSNQIEHSSNCASSIGNPSLVSDAASCVAWKASNINHVAACSSMDGSPKLPQKLNFRKTRAREISYDDSLEDTASSPVNSPKVSSLKQMDINHRKTDDNIESSLGKGGGCDDHHSQQQTDERDEKNFDGKNNDCTDLKKRGLCLVPLSMFVNYLG
ncbi:hypothetical protein F0562_008304 [Nyssa sinensis]|uniref:Uncharacterized protein n=1 Tax=Nyssa sinensis TaxID=561372 RepID=A0A5J5A6I9_9ASTE|nr:hypothetical protein F0562_008304 [Nyssa sinensis]